MANKYDIIHIDFQASARGANAAIESIRKEAQQTSDKITALKKNIEAGVAAKMDNQAIEGMRAEQRVLEKRYKQLTQAQNELIKGMRVLDEGVKQFNNGALSQMNAAFQKSVNNAAKLAQSKMTTGSKEWREMGAIMQETEQNYARMQRDTEQLITNLQNGGTVFVKTLEDEKKGLRDLLQVLPYMGTEYRKAEEQLQILVKTTDEMAIKERQLKGEIVTTNDAHRVRIQLTEQGAEAARKDAEAAQAEIDKGKQQIDTLEKEKVAIEEKARASASAAAKYTEDLQMYDDYIEELNKEIDADKKAAKSRREKAEQLRAEANSAQVNANKQREAQKIVDQAYDEAAAKVENLKQQLNDLKRGVTTGAPKTDQTTEAIKQGAEEAGKKIVETQQKEQLSKEELTAAIKKQKDELEKLEAEKKAIIEAQEESARTTNAEAEAYKNLTKEQAQAMLEQKQAKATFKNEGGKWQISNLEEAQQYLFDTLGEIEPNNLGKTHLELNGGADSVNKLLGKFKERYGMQSDDDAMGAIRELMSGGMVKNGFMNKFILNLDQNTQKMTAFNNEIKSLTDIINADTKATDANAEKKRTLEEVEAEITKIEREKLVNVKLLRRLNEGDIKTTGEDTKNTIDNTAAKQKNVEAINAEIEAIKKLNKEQALAMKAEMTNPSKVGFKAKKLDAPNIEEVQSFIIARMKNIEPANKKSSTLSLGGSQVDKLVKDFQERYGFKGEPKTAKELLKQIATSSEGLFKGGGQADFSDFGSFIVNIDPSAYEARVVKLKELVKITSDTAQATDRLSEATKKGTSASKESAAASDEQTDAIVNQIDEVTRRYAAYDAANKEFEAKVAELDKLKKAKSNLPKSGPDAALQKAELEDKIKEYNENVVSPARAEKNRLKKLWESSQIKLVEMQNPEEAAKKTRKSTKTTEEDTQATEKNTKAKKDNSKASQEEIERKQKEAEIKQQLTQAEEELTEAKAKQREEQSKTNRMDREAMDKQQKAAEAERNVGGKAKEKMEELQKTQEDRAQLIDDNKNTLKDNETNQKQLADINDKLKEQSDRIRENEQIKAQANTEGIEKTEQAIRLLQEENRRIDTNSDKWKENTKDIQALQAALDEMKGKPALMMMEERMGNVKNLSSAALTETKKFWEAMAAGASKGSAELKTAEANLKAIANEESKRNKVSLKTKAGRLDNVGRYSEGEVRESIDAAKQLIQTYKVGGKDATELAKKIVDAEEYIKKYGLEAARTAQREADAIAEANKRRQESDDIMRKQLEQGTELSESALKAQQQYWQRLIDDPKTAADSIEAYKKELEKVQEIQRQQEDTTRNERAGRISSASNLGDYSESEIREAIEATKQLMQAVNTSDEKYKQYGQSIATAEEYLRKYGLEAQRAALREEAAMAEQIKKEEELRNMMKLRLKDLSTLSASALEETKKYWDAQYNGATKGSKAMIEAERALRDIANIEKRQSSERAAGILDNTGRYGVADIKSAIQDMERLRDSVTHGGLEWTKYNRYVEQGKKYLDDLAHTDALQKMNTNMQNLTTLSSAALTETKKFWETMATGASKGSAELKTAEANLKAITDLEKERANTANKDKADVLLYGTLQNYSEREIREAIEAAKAFRNELATGDKDAERYAEAIAKAEAHIKKYGVETARAAQKQKENDDLMRAQLSRMFNDMYTGAGMPSESQLKAQKQYWQRLIDDPKTAASSLTEYRNALADVEMMEADMVKIGGQTALAWFGQGGDKNASENQIKEMAAKLKEYRGTLLKETNADELAQIDAILQKVGQSAKKTAEDVMSLDDALTLAEGAGKDGFLASPQQIQQATKALNDRRDAVIKLIQDNKALGLSTEAEENELADLTKKLRDLKFEQDNYNMSQEKMRLLMETPTKAVNLEELREAIKRADAELKRMEGSLGDNSDEYKNFAKQVKEAKNVLKDMEGQAKATSSVWEKAWSRLKTYVGMYMGFNMAWQRVTGSIDDLMTLSDKMGEVRKTTNLSTEAVGRLSESLRKLDVRTPLDQLMEISASAGQLGLKSEEDIMGFTVAANKMMIALPEMGKEATTEMMRVAIATGEVDRIKKQMEEGIVDGSSATAVAMEKIASTIDRLRATSAATAPEITDFVKRVGAVGAQSGISIDQVAALGSTISSLGMRVEMSATALSRMIPAIKNNAFAVANAIGVTPDSLRNLFEAGRGMEAILMIFQHLKDQNMNADSIEKLLGIGGMQDVMKQLNQQGARAGIVFAGLSQNVDVLRQQLVTANQAYEENIAIQNEFNKMNDTTAAKWERFKNQIEEMFVGDSAQRWLGNIIEVLREIFNLLTGNNSVAAGVRTIIVLFGVIKLNLTGLIFSTKEWGLNLTKIAVTIGLIDKETKKLQWGNIFTALAAAALWAWHEMSMLKDTIGETTSALAKANEETIKQTSAVDNLFRVVAKTNAEYENAKKKLDGIKDSTEETAAAEEKLKKASTEHASAIRDINSKYGSYLGYMLSETANAQQLAAARELINKKLRETITLKQQEAALGGVEQEYGGRVNKRASTMEGTLQSLFGNNYERSSNVSVAISEAAQKYAMDSDKFQAAVRKILSANMGSYKKINERWIDANMNIFEDYRKSIEDYQKQQDVVLNRFEAANNVNNKQTREAVNKSLNVTLATYQDLLTKYQNANGEEKEKLALEVYKLQRGYINEVKNNEDYLYDSNRSTYDSNIKKMQFFEKQLRKVSGEAIRTYDAMERAETKVTGTDFSNEGESGNNPWGGSHEGTSTDWKNMTANQLVERRKQMNEFVKAIQTDSDVQSVLGEDAALKAAIEKGMSSDMRTVINWYNTERLKIQDELHARFLTNTGAWQDPKQSRARRKRLLDDMRAYLEELDAYYTERKTRIQEAGNEEGVTEAEVRNRTLANEMEWRQRRAKLQIMYSKRAKEITQQEQDAISEIIAERTGDDANFIKQTIKQTVKFSEAIRDANAQGAKEYRKFQGDLDLGSEKDFNKVQMALRQQLKAIEDIIDKERPFNGITKNLRENLVTMGILTADMSKERDRLMKENADMMDFNARQAAEEVKRTAFMLGEAENAYSTTIEEVMRHMADKGMQAWADELKQSPVMQEGMMAQLRSTYDAIQDAIKKEASQLKKQAEIMWNNILMPDGKTTLKDATDRAIAQLSLDQNRIQRANGLIGAGAASERVVDRIAIKQMQLQLTMQEHYYNLMKKRGMEQYRILLAQAEAARQRGDYEEATRKELDAQHAEMALNLATAKEETELAKQREEIIARTEDSQNRLYTTLREWATLLSSSVQSVMEASHAGDAEYYNERAKMELTGKGGPGAGMYVIIDNEGTSDARAHYEYLDQEQALERQREIENENAVAEAWEKLWDDLNMKLNDQITDWINASMQNESIDANTQAVIANTQALYATMGGKSAGFTDVSKLKRNESGQAVDDLGMAIAPIAPTGEQQTEEMPKAPWQMTEDELSDAQENLDMLWQGYKNSAITAMQEMTDASAEMPETVVHPPYLMTEEQIEESVKRTQDLANRQAQVEIDASKKKTDVVVSNAAKEAKATKEATDNEVTSTSSAYSKMAAACNMYGLAYQTVTNDNLDASQKFQMFALQAAGQTAIGMLTTDLFLQQGKAKVELPGILGKAASQLGPIAGPIAFAAMTALLGGLMGMAVSQVGKSKSQIAQVTGASVGAGRLATGMLTYSEGNVNEFTNPASLTPGRSYNVDGADGKTYRAKYTGANPSTHLTNGPEFHLAGEKGREMIIDAGTTRQITMNDNVIWQAIKTLSGGGRIQSSRRRRSGVRAFADGNVDEFDSVVKDDLTTDLGFDPAALQASIDRNSEVLERALTEGIKGVFNVYGPDGLVASYDKGKKNANRHGEKY